MLLWWYNTMPASWSSTTRSVHPSSYIRQNQTRPRAYNLTCTSTAARFQCFDVNKHPFDRFWRQEGDYYHGPRYKLQSGTFRPLDIGTRRARFLRRRPTRQVSLEEEAFWCSGGRGGRTKGLTSGLPIPTRLFCTTRRSGTDLVFGVVCVTNYSGVVVSPLFKVRERCFSSGSRARCPITPSAGSGLSGVLSMPTYVFCLVSHSFTTRPPPCARAPTPA